MPSTIHYCTQSTAADPLMQRISAGFLLLTIASVALAIAAALQVMVSDLSVLPVNFRMWLLGLTRIATHSVEPPMMVMAVIGLRAVTKRFNDKCGISRGLSNSAYAAAIAGAMLLAITRYGLSFTLDLVARLAPDSLENVALVYCLQNTCAYALCIPALWIITLAIYRVITRMDLKGATKETWLLATAASLYLMIQIVLSLANYASYAGKIDYSVARKMLMFAAIGTLMQLIILSWLSIFFIRIWKAAKKRGKVC